MSAALPANFREFIREKTPEKLLEAINTYRSDRIKASAVHVWSSRFDIPEAVWPYLMASYPELSITTLLLWRKAGDDARQLAALARAATDSSEV